MIYEFFFTRREILHSTQTEFELRCETSRNISVDYCKEGDKLDEKNIFITRKSISIYQIQSSEYAYTFNGNVKNPDVACAQTSTSKQQLHTSHIFGHGVTYVRGCRLLLPSLFNRVAMSWVGRTFCIDTLTPTLNCSSSAPEWTNNQTTGPSYWRRQ